MFTDLTQQADRDAIRAALDVTLTDAEVPDATIQLSPYLPAAVAEVLRRDPDAADRSGAALEAVQRAVVLLTAARLAPAVPQLVSESADETTATWQRVDWTKRAAELRALAAAEIAVAIGPVSRTPATPPFFGLARGGRGR